MRGGSEVGVKWCLVRDVVIGEKLREGTMLLVFILPQPRGKDLLILNTFWGFPVLLKTCKTTRGIPNQLFHSGV